MSEYFTYILYSPSLGSFYKGHTHDIKARLIRHNSGSEEFTSRGMPWTLVWFTEKATKGDAYHLELKLKKLNRKRLMDFMTRYKDDLTQEGKLLMNALESRPGDQPRYRKKNQPFDRYI